MLYVLVKSMAASAICKIKHEACGQDVNKAQGKAECFIGIKAACRVLYFTYSKSYFVILGKTILDDILCKRFSD